jgi:hypothetical protein
MDLWQLRQRRCIATWWSFCDIHLLILLTILFDFFFAEVENLWPAHCSYFVFESIFNIFSNGPTMTTTTMTMNMLLQCTPK